MPNIVLIITDDQGWADIGYNNPDRVYTPNMDRLATEGAVFTNHYVMPQCTPTRVAAFTGCLPGRFGRSALSASNAPSFPIGTPTLATLLKDAGYNTYLIGKWHMGSAPEHGPNHHGFDYSYGSLAGAIGMYDHRYRKGPFEETWHRNHEILPGWENGVHATDLIANDAVRVLDEAHENPFFMMLTFHAPHTPLDERGSFVDQPTQLDPENLQRWLNEDEIKWFHDPKGIIQKEREPEKRLFLAVMHHLDHAIGRVVDTLEKNGHRKDTILLFSSDNGPQIGWPGNAYPDDLKLTNINQTIPMRGQKCDVWEGGIKVPGFVNWPGRIDPKEINETVHIIDWLPTIAKLVGAEVPDNLDGIDLGPLLFDDESLDQRPIHWTWGGKPNRWALRHGEWKLVRYSKEGAAEQASDWELYNLKEDPKEQTDVSGEFPEVLSELHQLYLKQSGKDQL
ncbi:MAG: sulfatase [Lentimonas sp.]